MATRTSLTRWAAALALGLGTVACGGAQAPAPTAEAPAGEQAASASLLTLMANAPTSVRFEGVRRFEAYWPSGGVAQQLAYRESVVADGTGKFALTALEVLAPPMGAADEALFKVTQKLRARTMYFARDFGIRELGQFELNYKLIDTGQPTLVAGVPCQRMIVVERVAPDRRFLLDVHTSTGLVLSSREELLDGTLVALIEFEAIDFDPDLTNVIWDAKLATEEVDLVPGSQQAIVKLGFVPRLPKVLPGGWKQTGFSKLTDPTNGEVWAKAVYSDGVEQVFFVVAKGKGPEHQLENPPPGTPPAHADRVSKMAVGNWTLLDADLDQGHALVLGRTQDGLLEGLVQSAFY